MNVNCFGKGKATNLSKRLWTFTKCYIKTISRTQRRRRCYQITLKMSKIVITSILSKMSKIIRRIAPGSKPFLRNNLILERNPRKKWRDSLIL